MLETALFVLFLYFILAFILLESLTRTPVMRLVEVGSADLPSVSVVIAARDEEEKIEEALQSILTMKYDSLEVCVVDDRSTDRTPAILHSLQIRYPFLKIVRIDTLPKGWIGKNHALFQGARASRGDYLLFTDADVVYSRSILKKVMTYVTAHELDHLTVLPRIWSRSYYLDSFISFFGMCFILFCRPTKVRDPRSRHFIGVGAFNLVRRTSYEKAGGHQTICLRPDDDVKLGKILKLGGAKCDCASESKEIYCEWHATLWSALRGLEKSSFPGLDYKVLSLVFFSVSLAILFLGPYLGVLFASGSPRLVFLTCCIISMACLSYCSAKIGGRIEVGLYFPILAVLFLFMMVDSALRVLIKGGIHWRGTFYPLSELRGNKV